MRRKNGRRIAVPPVTKLPEIFPFGRIAASVREKQQARRVLMLIVMLERWWWRWRECSILMVAMAREDRGVGVVEEEEVIQLLMMVQLLVLGLAVVMMGK